MYLLNILVLIAIVITQGCQSSLTEPIVGQSSISVIKSSGALASSNNNEVSSATLSSSQGILKLSSSLIMLSSISTTKSSSSFDVLLSSSCAAYQSSSSISSIELSSSSMVLSSISNNKSSSSVGNLNSSSSVVILSSSSILSIEDSLNKQLTSSATIKGYFDNNITDKQVLVKGSVISILSDDTIGDKHQRFIIRIDNGMTLLVAHNIDVATRVPNTIINKIVYVYGEYYWDSLGGGVHWTHKDLTGSHINGFVEYMGIIYQ